jgi:1-acyl-sn-glycerol-3-phosphate acyltransferase
MQAKIGLQRYLKNITFGRKLHEVPPKKSLDTWALNYWLLQRYAKISFRIYYRKIAFINRHRLPVNQSVILAPNHQNALMDAMLWVCLTEYQTVFLARADIFKGKRLIRFLNYLNIMPIYRIRDGIENVRRNDEVFEKTSRVLHNRYNPLCLFPEGNHGDKRRLRNLVKGLFRIAFMAQEAFGEQPGVKIVPVGVDYGHYQHFRSSLFVNIGESIEVSEYYREYRENPVNGINKLKERYIAEIRKLMIDIQTEEFYDLYMALRTVYNQSMRIRMGIKGSTLADRFRADKQMITMLDQQLVRDRQILVQLNEWMCAYQEGLKKMRLRDWVLQKSRYSLPGILGETLAMAALMPLFVVGAVENYLPYWFTASRVTGIKDPQFHSSFKYVIGMIAFPVWYVVWIGILCFLTFPVWAKALDIVTLPLLGLFSFHYYIRVKKLTARFRYTCQVIRKNPLILDLQKKRHNILHKTDSVIEQIQSNP